MAKGIYVGVSETEKLTVFSTCPFPDFTTNTATDKYGTWTVSCSSQRNSTTYAAYNAFDTDTGTLWGSGKLTTNFAYVQLDFPQGVSIKPTTVMMTYASCGTGSCVQGYNPDAGEWVTIGNTSQLSTSDKVERFEYSGTVYFTAIRAYANAYSGSYAYVSNLKITAGTIKNVGQYTIAHKVTKAYVGVDDKARKIKKGYIGVGGVARPFFSSEKELSYYGTASDLGRARGYLAGASNANYALFAGGTSSLGDETLVDAYSTSLTKSTPTGFSSATSNPAGTSVGDYAIFAGGTTGSTRHSKVIAYNSSLTQNTSASSLTVARCWLAGASNGKYAIFAGGNSSGVTARATVDAYNTSLTKSTSTDLSVARYYLAGASVVDYALFAGGTTNSNRYATVDAYNASLTRSTPTELSIKRYQLAGASNTSYALFAGGIDSSSAATATVDAYNSSLTRSTPTELSAARYALAGANVGGYAIFAGGAKTNTVDVYGANLTRSTPTALSVARRFFEGASIGDYVLFAGGYAGSYYATVDVYQAV